MIKAVDYEGKLYSADNKSKRIPCEYGSVCISNIETITNYCSLNENPLYCEMYHAIEKFFRSIK